MRKPPRTCCAAGISLLRGDEGAGFFVFVGRLPGQPSRTADAGDRRVELDVPVAIGGPSGSAWRRCPVVVGGQVGGAAGAVSVGVLGQDVPVAADRASSPVGIRAVQVAGR